MDPLTITGLIKQIAATGPVAALMLLVLIMLYRKLSSTESCKDPTAVDPKAPPRVNPPCNRCLTCKERLLAEKDVQIQAVGDLVATALADMGKIHLEAVKAQEDSHTEEVKQERSRNDALQEKNEHTLREIITIFKGPEE
jgi:hypothetical protein